MTSFPKPAAAKTSHNGGIIASIIHSIHAKDWCVIIINDERDYSSIIGRYFIIARITRKINSKQILYTILHRDSTNY
jgi:hypothetical protein